MKVRAADQDEVKAMAKWLALLWQGLVHGPRPARAVALDRDRRQALRFPSKQPVSCLLVLTPTEPPLPARTRDISLGGIGLDCPRFVEPETLLEIQRPALDGRSPWRLLSCVRHARPAGDTWVLGCSFIRDLDDAELEAFAVCA